MRQSHRQMLTGQSHPPRAELGSTFIGQEMTASRKFINAQQRSKRAPDTQNSAAAEAIQHMPHALPLYGMPPGSKLRDIFERQLFPAADCPTSASHTPSAVRPVGTSSRMRSSVSAACVGRITVLHGSADFEMADCCSRLRPSTPAADVRTRQSYAPFDFGGLNRDDHLHAALGTASDPIIQQRRSKSGEDSTTIRFTPSGNAGSCAYPRLSTCASAISPCASSAKIRTLNLPPNPASARPRVAQPG